MMQLDLNQDGDPQSAFIQACSGRRINLAGSDEGPHPLQLIPSQWRALKVSLTTFVDELAIVEAAFQPDGDALLIAFRQLTYDATELFDSYALLIVSRLDRHPKGGRAVIAEFRKTAKRLRDDCALICNRFKHNGAQVKFLWASSPSNGLTGSRVLISSYDGNGGLLRDDRVHKGKMSGIGLVRWGQQLVHNLLRIDRAAGVLIEGLTDTDCDSMPTLPPTLAVGATMRKLSTMRATRHADEPALHDGISFSDKTVSLIRAPADDFGPSATVVSMLTIEVGTTRYSVA